MIYVYEKSKTSDLTPKQIEMLRKTFIGGLKTFVGRIRRGKFSNASKEPATQMDTAPGVDLTDTTSIEANKDGEKAKKDSKKS